MKVICELNKDPLKTLTGYLFPAPKYHFSDSHYIKQRAYYWLGNGISLDVSADFQHCFDVHSFRITEIQKVMYGINHE
jgi:hypothetical protein